MTAAAIAAVLLLALSGCTTPEPEPTPTPAFSSEAEAFAAAEATYRAYVDALNQVDLSDPGTFEAVYALTTGEANADFRKSFSTMQAKGYSITGISTATLVQPLEVDGEQSVKLAVCLDVSQVEVVDPSGASVVDPDRLPVQAMTIVADTAHSAPSGMLISQIVGRDGEPTCV